MAWLIQQRRGEDKNGKQKKEPRDIANLFSDLSAFHRLCVSQRRESGTQEKKEKNFTARYDYDSIDIHDGSWLSPIENSWAINGPEGKPHKIDFFFRHERWDKIKYWHTFLVFWALKQRLLAQEIVCMFSYHHRFANFEGMFKRNRNTFQLLDFSSFYAHAACKVIKFKNVSMLFLLEERQPGKCEQANKHFLVRKLQNISSPAEGHNQLWGWQGNSRVEMGIYDNKNIPKCKGSWVWLEMKSLGWKYFDGFNILLRAVT